jgi:hypothetical protein
VKFNHRCYIFLLLSITIVLAVVMFIVFISVLVTFVLKCRKILKE